MTNFEEITGQRTLQYDWLTAIPDHTHPKKSFSLFSSCVYLYIKNQTDPVFNLDVTDQRTALITDYTHPKKECWSFFFLYVYLYVKKQDYSMTNSGDIADQSIL